MTPTPSGRRHPEPWRVIGRVLPEAGDGIRVTVDGVVPDARGWDHFAG